jgi:4-amino-4-deoxy-L-arabinose transferase-like glycosyltransferase
MISVLVVVGATALLFYCFLHYQQDPSGWEVPVALCASLAMFVALLALLGIFNFIVLVLLGMMVFFYIEWRKHSLQKTKRAVLVLFAVTLVIVSGRFIWSSQHQGRIISRRIDRERGYFGASFRYLGDYIKEQFNPEEIMLLYSDDDDSVNLASQYLENGRRFAVLPTKVKQPLTWEQLDKAFQQNVRSTVFLSLLGCPIDLPISSSRSKKRGRQQQKLQYKLLAVSDANVDQKTVNAIRTGLITAVAMRRELPSSEFLNPGKIPDSDSEAFKKRFVLIDKNSLESARIEMPELFQ